MMRDRFLAIALGIGIGFALCPVIQDGLNASEQSRCQGLPASSLVKIKTFWGHAMYCLPNYATGAYTGP